MNRRERASLAEQILANPVYAEIIDTMEANAVERLVFAPNEQERLEGALRVQSIRAFRSDCEALLRSTHERKGAPA